MKALMLKCGKYLLSINAGFRKTAKAAGFISNNISVISKHSEQIEKLAAPIGWRLLEMKPKYDAKTNSMSPHQYYLGFVKSNDCTDADDFVIAE
jgi:hypothetical protein